MTTIAGRVIEYDVPSYYKAPPPMAFSEGCALEITGQVHRSDLNGKFAVCVGRDGMRTLVLTRSGDTLSVADSHLRVAELVPGTRVTLVGLSGELAHYNGVIGALVSFSEAERNWLVRLNDQPTDIPSPQPGPSSHTVSVRAVNVVITPAGSEEVEGFPLVSGKKRRLLANLVSSATEPTLAGAPGLLAGNPLAGASARLIAIDASVALSSQQPILKRCGTLRKLVHGFPGFAQLAVCLVVKLHMDPTHPGRRIDAGDIEEATRIASLLTEGRLDGIPRKSLRELVAAGEVALETVLRIADRYCGAVHLVFAIDSNFANVKDTIAAMVLEITGGRQLAAIAEEAVAAADVLMQDAATAALPAALVADTPIVPVEKAMTTLMASRYAKPAVAAKQEDGPQ